MAVQFSSPNMAIHLRNHSSPSPRSLNVLSFQKAIYVNHFKFKLASNFTHKPSFLTINAYQKDSEQPQTFVSEELEPKRSMPASTMPEIENFKEPEPKNQSLKFVEANQSDASSSKVKVATQTSMDYQEVLKYPLVTEAAIKKIIEENTLVFMVDVRANKKDIRNAFENMLHIKTKKINTLINYDGTKKAYIQLSPDNEAVTVAKKMKILA